MLLWKRAKFSNKHVLNLRRELAASFWSHVSLNGVTKEAHEVLPLI